MRSLMKNLFTSHMRNLTTEDEGEDEDDYIFKMQSFPGDVLRDSITGVPAVTSISGVRYGIVNGAVTQFAVNQPPIEDGGLRGCPAFTQLAKMSETLTDAAWAKTGTKTPVKDVDYQGKKSWRMIEDTTTGAHRVFYTTSDIADNSVLGFCGVFKSSNRHIGIAIRDKTGTDKLTRIDLLTGVIMSNTNTSVNISYLGDGYYQCFVATSVGTGGTIPLVLLYRTKPDGVQSYTGDDESFIVMAQPTIINFGVNGTPFIPPYVPNDTTGSISVVSEAATATTGTSFDLDDVKLARLRTALRGPNAQGHLELTFKSNIDSGWLANNFVLNIMTLVNAYFGPVYIYKDTSGVCKVQMYDNATVIVLNNTLSIGQTFKISLDWGTHITGQKMRLTVNGVKSVLVSFSGSFGSQDLRFFYDNTVHAGWIVKDSLKIGDRPIW